MKTRTIALRSLEQQPESRALATPLRAATGRSPRAVAAAGKAVNRLATRALWTRDFRASGKPGKVRQG